MGLLDLSVSVSAKKNVDFSDARYLMSDRLRQDANKKNMRPAFTVYDNKDRDKVSIDDIRAAYELSDKHIPVGELLNKMLDLIVDMEDGVLDTEKDAVYAWKYSKALLQIFQDKRKRADASSMTQFDNSLKAQIINSRIFSERFPGKYNNRTNFFDKNVRNDMLNDILKTFEETALPGIYEAALKQSKEKAAKHENKLLDKIVKWAIEQYGCKTEAYYTVKQDKETGLFYCINTVIMHLKNGYDLSVVGYVGTEHDDKFELSVIDTETVQMQEHSEKADNEDAEAFIKDAAKKEKIHPLTKLLLAENKKTQVLKNQYDILFEIRPMVSAEILELQAAKDVVGENYIWGCKAFRETHRDLPADFKLEDVNLPSLDFIKPEEDDDAVSKATETLDASENNTVFTIEMNKRSTTGEKEKLSIKAPLLPGLIPIQEDEDLGEPSITGAASELSEVQKKEEPQPEFKAEEAEDEHKDEDKAEQEPEQPPTLLTDIDDLFA